MYRTVIYFLVIMFQIIPRIILATRKQTFLQTLHLFLAPKLMPRFAKFYAENLKHFVPNFSDPFIIFFELNESNMSTGSWHTLKLAKFLNNHFFTFLISIISNQTDIGKFCLIQTILQMYVLILLFYKKIIYRHTFHQP